ncbi:MAG TPA: GntR family transcriptional regulator [Ignavibacteria bacterium]|nr:GntR family transcriptional regulator [Ignavibacteria bacterium]
MKGNSKIVTKVAKYLRHQVTCNTLKSGMHVGESEIAGIFNISRVPVREAFRILQSEGYLEVKPNKGCYVKKISHQYLIETGIVYRLIAPVVLEKAIPNYTGRTYKKADQILDKIEKGSDFYEVGYLLWEFALLIYSPSKMKYMTAIFDDIYKHSIRFLNEFFENEENAIFKVTTHREFIELCRQNKKDDAIKLWTGFIDKLNEII